MSSSKPVKKPEKKRSLTTLESQMLEILREAGGEDVVTLLNTLIAIDALHSEIQSVHALRMTLVRLEHLGAIQIMSYKLGSDGLDLEIGLVKATDVDLEKGLRLDEAISRFRWIQPIRHEVQLRAG
jgi:hypothetical protein